MTRKEYQHNYYLSHREAINERHKKWQREHPEANKRWITKNRARHNFLSNRWAKEHPDKIKQYSYKYLYGITPEVMEATRIKQDNKCAICKRRKRLIVDHDHKTGIFRGLLCQKCNISLGGFGDDICMLKAAINYLQASQST